MNSLIKTLSAERDSITAAMEAITNDVAAQERTELTDTEEANFNDYAKKLEKINERIDQLTEIELRNAKTAEQLAKVTEGKPVQHRVSRGSEDAVYTADGRYSWVADIINARMGDSNAQERLELNNFQTRTVTTSSGADGFNPPAYLVSKYADVIRSNRPIADNLPNEGNPPSTVFHIPKITTGANVDWQSSEGSGFTTQDTVMGDVQVNTYMLSGYVPVSVQVQDFSPQYDAIVFRDLARAYAEKVEVAVVNKNSTGFQGILKQSGTASVAMTAALTAGGLLRKIGAAIDQVNTNSKSGPDAILMHPSLYTWLSLETDTTGRPLIAPYNPQNAPGTFGGVNAGGPKGEILGLPVITSYGIPTVTDGSTPSVTNSVVVCKLSDMMLWESGLTTTVDPYSSATSGKVNLIVRGYVAFTCGRRPESIAVVEGNGLQAGFSF